MDLDLWLAGIVVVALVGYLTYTVIYPEKF
jgi:K+-transporting ATPase KdpF subunit